MSKFSIDYAGLSNKIEKRAYKLSDVKDKIEKVAFDVVRFKDGDPEELWQIQSADDGDYIIALYEDNTAEKQKTSAASKNPWEVIVNSGYINIFYKGDAILKFASSKLGVEPKDIELMGKSLPKKLANNKELVTSLLKELVPTTKQEILTKYPELC